MAKGNGIPLWLLAAEMGISEQTLIRHWRKELLSDEKERIRFIINRLSHEAK